eukprot:1187221-Prorocentrum_minimum.AAC.3
MSVGQWDVSPHERRPIGCERMGVGQWDARLAHGAYPILGAVAPLPLAPPPSDQVRTHRDWRGVAGRLAAGGALGVSVSIPTSSSGDAADTAPPRGAIPRGTLTASFWAC